MLVPFSGDGSGTEELTWGQWDVWFMMRMSGTPRMAGGTMPLAAGTTVEQIAHLLSFIVSRHQSLRTRIQLSPDGTPSQVLSASGEVALEVVDTLDDPAAVAETVRARFASEPFELETDWPVRMAVVQQAGKPAHFVAMYPHVVIDGYGFDALARDLALLDQSTGQHLGPRSGVQPMDLARQQRGPSALRQSAASLRYWESVLRDNPVPQFGQLPLCSPRYWEATYDSPAALLALQALSVRTGLPSGPLLMAAYASALAEVTGVARRIIRTQVSNRFRPGFRDSVSILVQAGLCAVSTGGPLLDVAAAAWRSQLAAGKHAYYDPRSLWALLSALEAELGFAPDPLCYFNDRRRTVAGFDGVAPSRASILAAQPLSRLTPGVRYDNTDVTAYLNINAIPGTLNYTLRADTAALSPTDLEHILLSIESRLIHAAI